MYTKKGKSCLFIASKTIYSTCFKRILKKPFSPENYLDYDFSKFLNINKFFHLYKVISKKIHLIFLLNTDYVKNLINTINHKKVIVVGLINKNIISQFLDYPILSNNNFFYSYYFISKLFFKFLCLSRPMLNPGVSFRQRYLKKKAIKQRKKELKAIQNK